MSSSAPQPAKDSFVCLKCNGEIPAGGKFCLNCGVAIDSSASREVPAQAQPSTSRKQHRPDRYPKNLLQWTLVLSHSAQVLALILAGIWTYKTFYESELPMLERHLSTHARLEWKQIPGTKSGCLSELTITVKNTGKSSVDINAVNVAVWMRPFAISAKTPELVDEKKLMQSEPFFKEQITEGYLVRHYPPGAQVEQTMDWWMPKSPGQIMLADVSLISNQEMKYGAKSTDWDYVCKAVK